MQSFPSCRTGELLVVNGWFLLAAYLTLDRRLIVAGVGPIERFIRARYLPARFENLPSATDFRIMRFWDSSGDAIVELVSRLALRPECRHWHLVSGVKSFGGSSWSPTASCQLTGF